MGTKAPSLSYRISVISRFQRTRFDMRAHTMGITRSQWRTIHAISDEEGASQHRIAELIEVGDVTASRLVDRLVDSGWVERRADPGDRRSHRLYLTPLARPLLEQLSKLADDEERLALAGISAEDVATAMSVLEQVAANLEAVRHERCVAVASGKPA